MDKLLSYLFRRVDCGTDYTIRYTLREEVLYHTLVFDTLFRGLVSGAGPVD